MSPQAPANTAEQVTQSNTEKLLNTQANVFDVVHAKVQDADTGLPEYAQRAITNAALGKHLKDVPEILEQAYSGSEKPAVEDPYDSLTIAQFIGGTNAEVTQNEGAIEEAADKGKTKKPVLLETLGRAASVGLHDTELKAALFSENPTEGLQKLANGLLEPLKPAEARKFKKLMENNPDLKGKLGASAEGVPAVPGIARKLIEQTPKDQAATLARLRLSMTREKKGDMQLTTLTPFGEVFSTAEKMAQGAAIAVQKSTDLVINPDSIGNDPIVVQGAVAELVKDIEVSLQVKDANVVYPVDKKGQLEMAQKLAAIDSLRKAGKISDQQLEELFSHIQTPDHVISLVNYELSYLDPQAKQDLIRQAERQQMDIRLQKVKDAYMEGNNPPVLSEQLLKSKGISQEVNPQIIKQADAIAQGMVAAATIEAYTFNYDSPSAKADVISGVQEFIAQPIQERSRWVGIVEARSVDSAISAVGMRVVEVALTRDNARGDISGLFADAIKNFPRVQVGSRDVTPSVRQGAVDFVRVYLDNLVKVDPFKGARLREAFARSIGTSSWATLQERSISIIQPDIRSEKVGVTLQSNFDQLARDLAAYSDALPRNEAQAVPPKPEVQDTGKTLEAAHKDALELAAKIVLTARSSLVVIDAASPVEGTLFRRYPKRDILNEMIDRIGRVYESTRAQLENVDRKDETKMMAAVIEIIVPQAVIDDIPNLGSSSVQETRSLIQGIKAAYEKGTQPGKAPKMPEALVQRLTQAESALANRERALAESSITSLNSQIQETVKAGAENEKVRVAGNQLNAKWGINIPA